MAIQSVEELAALPVGSTIRVHSRQMGYLSYDRTEEGWRRDGAVLPSEFFIGYVVSGSVADATTADPTVGDWYESGTYWYLVTKLDADLDRAECLRFHRFDERGASPTTTHVGTTSLAAQRRYHRVATMPEGVRTEATFKWLFGQWQDATTKWESESKVAEELREERAVLKNRPEPGALRERVAAAQGFAASLADTLAALRDQIGGDLEN